MLFAVSVSEIGQHLVGIRWHRFEVIVCHFKRASLSSRLVKEIYSLNNVETNLKTPQLFHSTLVAPKTLTKTPTSPYLIR